MDTITIYNVQECVRDTHSTYVIISFSFSLVQFLFFPHPMFFSACISAESCGAIPHHERER